MLRTCAAVTNGGHIFRNRWRDTDDIVTRVFLMGEGESGWLHPVAGSIRLYGLGHARRIEGINDSNAGNRWFRNVIRLPEDDLVVVRILQRRETLEVRVEGAGFIAKAIVSGRTVAFDRKKVLFRE